MKYEKLDKAAIADRLQTASGWTLSEDGSAIARHFVFTDFGEAFAFMTRSALAAERLDHHPEWSNVYRHVDVKLTTHAAQGLTDLDFRLAAAMDRAAGGRD
ncbi:4a-hydroxytetrahydrobiopterin dehydratase [Rhizobium sp. S-51]|uniref:Putative pterin-4-alpha-carbinolamine dehydratase n=1 Tax=Rhizobium terricola TaxID=2728849 RepID=A0A7Y0AYC6_9HYPH|nr:4a-hydroxytetrahydrobiopterin dehydratase [Rhizobium terricola]NML75769.1 4a-hydroxytetrahydrobiopterin dehydratase [Rhizobium terricola]